MKSSSTSLLSASVNVLMIWWFFGVPGWFRFDIRNIWKRIIVFVRFILLFQFKKTFQFYFLFKVFYVDFNLFFVIISWRLILWIVFLKVNVLKDLSHFRLGHLYIELPLKLPFVSWQCFHIFLNEFELQNLWGHILGNRQLQYTYCPVSHEEKKIRQISLLS